MFDRINAAVRRVIAAPVTVLGWAVKWAVTSFVLWCLLMLAWACVRDDPDEYADYYSAAAAVVAIAAPPLAVWAAYRGPGAVVHVRRGAGEARQTRARPAGPCVYLAGEWVSEDETPFGCLTAGGTGAGKSSVNRLLAASILDLMGRPEGAGRSLIMGDMGRDYGPFLFSRVPRGVPLLVFCPPDARSVDIDWCELLTDAGRVQTHAQRLIQSAANDTSAFWYGKARNGLADTLNLFQMLARHGYHPYADPIRLLKNIQLCRELTDLFPQFGELRAITQPGEHGESLHSTIMEKLAALEPMAACMLRARRRVTFKELLDGPGDYVVYAPQPAEYRASVGPVMAHFCDGLVQTGLARAGGRPVHVVLDEPRFYGAKLPSVPMLAPLGRKPRLSLYVTLHSVRGMDSVYTKDESREFLNNLRFIVALNCEDPETAAYLAERLGKPEVVVQGPEYEPTHWSERDRYVIHPQELLDLPMPGRARDRIEGALRRPHTDAGRGGTRRVRFSFHRGTAVPPEVEAYFPAFVKRPDPDFVLPPLTLDDARRLGLPLDHDGVRTAIVNGLARRIP